MSEHIKEDYGYLGGDMAGEAERRYRNDPEFHAVVEYLHMVARARGYTPYELKQAAYMAALLVELRSTRHLHMPPEAQAGEAMTRDARQGELDRATIYAALNQLMIGLAWGEASDDPHDWRKELAVAKQRLADLMQEIGPDDFNDAQPPTKEGT